jgi:hypothetical protein
MESNRLTSAEVRIKDAEFWAKLKADDRQRRAESKAESKAWSARHKAIERALKRWRSTIKKGDTVSIQLPYSMPDVVVTSTPASGGFYHTPVDGAKGLAERKVWTYPPKVGAAVRAEMDRLGIKNTKSEILASAVGSWFDELPQTP